MKGQLAKSSLHTSAMLVLRVATQAATLLLLTRLFGPSLYGNFAAASSLAVLLGTIPTLGAGYLMLYRAADGTSATADVWRYAWPMTGVIGLLLLTPYVLASLGMMETTQLPSLALALVGASELLLLPFASLASFALQSREQVPMSQFLLWLPYVLRALAAAPCFAVAKEHRFAAYALLQFVASLAAVGVCIGIAHRQIKLDWRPRLPTPSELRQGSSYAAMHLVAMNPSEIDKVIALRVVGAHDAGIYATTSRLLGAAALPVVGMLLTAQPRLFRHARQGSVQAGRLIGIVAVLTLGWGLGCAAVLVLGSRLLPYLFGAVYDDMVSLMPWMAAVVPLLSLRLAAGTVLVAYAPPLERIAFELCGIAVLACSMIVLAPRLGLPGLALASIAAETIMNAIGWFLVLRQVARRRSAILHG